MTANNPLDGFRISKTQKALLTAHPASWESGAIGSVRGLVAQGLAEITGVGKQGGNKTLKYRILPGAGEACREALRAKNQ